ncbi:hypothetical protein L2X67_21600, partial [Enterobacter ludwigii]|nr:hypothetical protein [Enterobacter ludwigii]
FNGSGTKEHIGLLPRCTTFPCHLHDHRSLEKVFRQPEIMAPFLQRILPWSSLFACTPDKTR